MRTEPLGKKKDAPLSQHASLYRLPQVLTFARPLTLVALYLEGLPCRQASIVGGCSEEFFFPTEETKENQPGGMGRHCWAYGGGCDTSVSPREM